MNTLNTAERYNELSTAIKQQHHLLVSEYLKDSPMFHEHASRCKFWTQVLTTLTNFGSTAAEEMQQHMLDAIQSKDDELSEKAKNAMSVSDKELAYQYCDKIVQLESFPISAVTL